MPLLARTIRLWGTLCLALVAGTALAADAKPAPVDFARDVEPIFKEHCFRCHGPKRQESGYRLDRKQIAQKGGDSGRPAIVPGDPQQSALLALVRGDNPDLVMPPEGDGLTAAQIAVLTKWIAAGAARPADAADSRPPHWAFVPPQTPAIPAVKNAAWARNAIDSFVLSRLEKEGLEPSPEADRDTLLRRLSLDLIGLPPTPEEADAFRRDSRPDAYQQLVERLLASPHYGERWARRWLDLARYADTNGYEKDRVRSIWPYRDWVINSLNADLPFDRFTIEQLAGDMLPGATPAQKIATGFHRNTMVNEEGGIDVEEFRFHSIVDRVGTTGTVWLGLTVGCAQCHAHKYDPISQQEYYGLFAFLNNADEPEFDVPDAEVAARRAAIQTQIAQLEAGLERQFPIPDGASDKPADVRRAEHLQQRLAEWEKEAAANARHWTVVRPARVESQNHATITLLADDSVLVTGDKPNRDTYIVELPVEQEKITGLRLEVLPDESLPDGGPGRAPLFSVGDFLLSEFQAAAAPLRTTAAPAPIKLVDPTHSYAQSGRSAALAIDGDLDTGWSIQGKTGERHVAVFPLQEPINRAEGTRLVVTLVQHYIHQMTIGRFRLSITADSLPLPATDLPADVEEILVTAAERRSAPQQARLKQHFLTIAPELAEQHKQMAALRKSLPKFPTTLVFEERDAAHRRQTQRHHRGEFLKLREPIEPGTPAVLHPLAPDAPRDRLTFARWLVDSRNPLVGRVTMNRQWEAYFGRGLVRTSEDFGTQGAPPTHPELLDWLATEFVRRGWSLKQMHRLIVTSATYRQASRATPERLARDPQNELLARGPRLRLEAELIRDAALAASGLLSPKIGGPSVFPPQPDGVTKFSYGNFPWTTSTGESRYRRGLYTFAKRTAPYAAFTLFDAPSGEAACPRRDRSNTPLQALTLLNDAVFIEAAQALARRVVSGPDADPSARLTLVFRHCLTRPPTSDELSALLQFREQQLARLRTGELDAAKIAGDNPPPGVDRAELAAWTTVCRVLLNLDETVTKE